jgi:DNA polymerase III delta subunit
MIYLLYGEHVLAALAKVKVFEKRFRREVTHEWQLINFEEEGIDERFPATVGASLFAKKDYYIIKHASEASEESRELLLDLIKRWENDDSVVVFFERGVPLQNALFEKIKKASKHEELSLPADQKLGSVETSDRDLFLLGDLWGRREKSRLILKYEELLRHGFLPEDILRTLLWHVKNVCLASSGKTSEMKPFVAGKASQQARNFSADSLERAFTKLVGLDDKYKRETLETGLLHFFLTH